MNGTAYSVPAEARRLLFDGIVANEKVNRFTPPELEAEAKKVKFVGQDEPYVPINWRFSESISALKAFEGAMVNVLVKRKYNADAGQFEINTDHANLFYQSVFQTTVDVKSDEPVPIAVVGGKINVVKLESFFKNKDYHNAGATPWRRLVTNIFKTKDGRFFHTHGSMNPTPTLKSLGLEADRDVDAAEALSIFAQKVGDLDSAELQHLATDVYKQAGTICYTVDEFKASEHGKANAHIALYDLHHLPDSTQAATWWPNSAQTSPQRPLAGLKVVDLSRIIAAPTITKTLAEYGASIMRVTAPHICDIHRLHVDLNWGKWNSELDLRQEADQAKLRELILDADVVLDAYRPGTFDKYGFGKDAVLELIRTSKRGRGIIYAREDTNGWQGPWKHRAGWQQLSDAITGISYRFGQAMGNDEPVTPVFPNSDFCTGSAGATGIMNALILRAEQGGSYVVDIALNYYNTWLIDSCGEYPPEVWSRIHRKNGSPVFRHNATMGDTLPVMFKMLRDNSGDILFRDDFFVDRVAGALKTADRKEPVVIRSVKPVCKWNDAKSVQPGFNVSTRGSGVDAPRWPTELMTEVVV